MYIVRNGDIQIDLDEAECFAVCSGCGKEIKDIDYEMLLVYCDGADWHCPECHKELNTQPEDDAPPCSTE